MTIAIIYRCLQRAFWTTLKQCCFNVRQQRATLNQCWNMVAYESWSNVENVTLFQRQNSTLIQHRNDVEIKLKLCWCAFENMSNLSDFLKLCCIYIHFFLLVLADLCVLTLYLEKKIKSNLEFVLHLNPGSIHPLLNNLSTKSLLKCRTWKRKC